LERTAGKGGAGPGRAAGPNAPGRGRLRSRRGGTRGPAAGVAPPAPTPARRGGAPFLRGPVGGADGRRDGLPRRHGEVTGVQSDGFVAVGGVEMSDQETRLRELLERMADEADAPPAMTKPTMRR